MSELKAPYTYEEQLNHLIEFHNLTVLNKDFAIQVLEKINYYRLSAYGIGLTKEDDSNKYRDEITFEQIYKLYEFDSFFRNILIHVIEQLEIRLRTQISNFLALRYGAEGYLDIANFRDKKDKNGKSIHSNIIESFKKECEHQKNTPFVKHHINKYNGHFPIWVAIELLTFGNLSSIYSIMFEKDRKVISEIYQTRPKYLKSWILSLVEARNICAHYGRIYNMPLKQTPHLYSENKKYRTQPINKIFPVLLVMKRMLQGDNLWFLFVDKLEELIKKYDDVVNLSFIGFPPNWEQILSIPQFL